MRIEVWLGAILLLCRLFCSTIGAFVGINIGTDVTNLPSATDIIGILKTNRINHVRLFDSDAHILSALSNTGIEVMVGVTNEEVLGIGESPSAAAAWINKNVAAYLPGTNITAIAVGSEVLTSIPNAAPVLVPAMNNLMFDALVDATYNSISALNFSKIPIVVTETGWPWFGGAKEPYATIENAETFNNNLIRRVSNDSGPPSQPDIPINTYIYELFNEDKRRGPVSERNWGVLFPNSTSVYSISLSNSGSLNANSSTVFCIVKPGANEDSLRSGIDWACGPGQANCRAIQQGQPCYLPDTWQNHASYAYNDYYQKMHSSGGTCDFDGTATTTSIDPSYGSCRFSGSSNSSTGRLVPPPAFGPVGQSSRSSRNYIYFHQIGLLSAVVLALILV
ncbi:glucan endo-1,3-beta-glucosidase 4-like [Olea europaea subsp. europaea]|uniref:Glucan endo-1,3-beta-glucosidase 4-like n=1 Tax=Olea europaea subsp. europaea TaxID=158383 RepID=A0A8S0S9H9_OLEEU|nr:glucan endo-1,3-beta-glucosidase 4-like [Olea europaea subsp. europaea]